MQRWRAGCGRCVWEEVVAWALFHVARQVAAAGCFLWEDRQPTCAPRVAMGGHRARMLGEHTLGNALRLRPLTTSLGARRLPM